MAMVEVGSRTGEGVHKTHFVEVGGLAIFGGLALEYDARDGTPPEVHMTQHQDALSASLSADDVIHQLDLAANLEH